MAFFGGLGTGGLRIQIHLSGTPETHPNDAVYVRHRPSWKVRKNAFAALRGRSLNEGGGGGGASASDSPTLAPGGDGRQQQPPVPDGASHQGGGAGGGRIVVYSSEHDTEGEVTLTMPHGKKLDHMGVQVKFFGRIDMVSRHVCG